MNDNSFTIFCFTVFAILALAFVGLFWISHTRCESRATLMETEYKWGIVLGCMIKDKKDGKWVPIENYRVLAP